MIEKVGRVNNPLTVIAIFAGLAEVAGSVALVAVDTSIQGTFVWFVMLFPAALVVMFFATLNSNPRVLYAPSDFKDEENFLSALAGRQKIEKQFDAVLKQLEVSQKKIIEDVANKTGKEGDTQADLREEIESQLSIIREKLAATRQTADDYVVESVFPQSALQSNVLKYISAQPEGATLGEIVAETGMPKESAMRAVHRMVERGLLVRTGTGRMVKYRAAVPGRGMPGLDMDQFDGQLHI